MVFAVLGATGNVGGELVALLEAGGHEVRALSRSGAHPVDLNDGATLRPAVAGADGAFLLAGYDDAGIVEALEDAGVPRAALLSSGAIPTTGRENAVTAYHLDSEAALEGSGLGWTFLRPDSFMSNALRWRDAIHNGDPVVAPFAEVPIAVNDPRDVAAIAALALTTGEHDGQAYRISGPEALRPAEQVAILADVLGRDIGFEAQDDEAARAKMEGSMPRPYVDAFFELFVEGKHDETRVLPTVEELLDRPPRTFREWAIEHADAF